MNRQSLFFYCLAALILSTGAAPADKDVVEDVSNIGNKEIDEHKVTDIENKVQDQPVPLPQGVDRVDEELTPSVIENLGVNTENKEDLETANTFWGGYYRSPSWGWNRGWGYGGYYPSYRSWGYGGRGWGYGGRGYNGWGWGNGYRRGHYW